MVKNIIFDLGNVLIEYNPKKFIEKFVAKENREKFFEIVFKSKEWLELDRGTLEYEEAIEIFSTKIPKERANIEKLFNENIEGVLFPIEENLKLLPVLKSKGLKLYILSNFHKGAYLNIAKRCNFDEYFDGGVVSYEVKLLKPEKEIYEEILRKYDLKAEETLFIDDTLANIEAANSLKIKGIHLPKKEELAEKLKMGLI